MREENNFSKGVCQMPSLPRVARAALHFGEEPCISGKNGSGTIFFSGCSLQCRFCQNHSISQENFGKTISIQQLSDIFYRLEQQGAHNINLVNPTHFAPAIRQALLLYKPHIPIIYNSGGYERVETLKSLEGLIDVYLPDLKYVHSDVAKALSGCENYFQFAGPAILEMLRQTGNVILDNNGMIQKGTMVRHLALPGLTRETISVLEWLANQSTDIWISMMFQYTPMRDIKEFPQLSRTLTKRECEKIWQYMQKLELSNGYIQDKSSSGTAMIPSFDLSGI